MRTNRRIAPFFSILVFSGLFSSPAQDLSAASPQIASGSLSAVSTGFSATLPDSKRPGKLLVELHGASDSTHSGAGGFHSDASSLWARLYQNGFPSAVLTAPRALVNSINKVVTVTGLGGVVVKSLTEPGTKLTADTVVWYASQSKMVATGHVFYRNGKTGATMSGPRMVADTRLKTISINAGHGTAQF